MSVLADLVKPGIGAGEEEDDELDQDEINVLIEAGVIASSSSQIKKSGKKKAKAKHIVFVENEEQGLFFL